MSEAYNSAELVPLIERVLDGSANEAFFILRPADRFWRTKRGFPIG